MRISNWSLNVSVKHFAMHLPGCTGKDALRSRRSCDSILSNSRMVSPKFCRKWITTPSAPLRKLRDNLLMSRPPLLEEEGKKLVLNGVQDHNLLTSISPNAQWDVFPTCRCDLIWTAQPRRGGEN